MSWRRFFRRDKREQDLEAEICAHLEMETQDWIERGESPQDARLRAYRDFGNVALVKEVTRQFWGLAFLYGLVDDLRFSIRRCLRHPGFSTAVVLILGITVGVNVAIFSVMNTVMLRPLPYEDAERVVTFDVLNSRTQEISGGVAPGLMRDLQESGAFESVAVSVLTGGNWTGAGNPEVLQGVMVSSSFFDVLRIKPEIGRSIDAQDSAAAADPVVMFTYDLWSRRFGRARDAIGRTVVLDGAPYTLVGVLPKGFIFPDGMDVDFFRPLFLSPADLYFHNAGGHLAYARLRTSVDFDQAQTILDDVAKTLESRYPETNAGLSLRLVAVKERLLDNPPPFLVVQAAGLFVLLIGCANLASLFLSRSIARSRELLVRASIGASRRRLVRQLLTDAGVLGALGGVLGLFLATWTVGTFRFLLPDVPRIDDIGLDLNVLAFASGITILSILFFALLPAYRSSNPRLNLALSNTTARSISGWGRLQSRGILVGAEVAMTVLLLILAGLTTNSTIRLHNVDPGFNPKNILTMYVRPAGFSSRDPREFSAFYEEAVHRIQGVPGVQGAAAVTYIPMVGVSGGRTAITRGGLSEAGRVRLITPDYFRVLSIPVLRGRGFDVQDRENSPTVAMVNETLAKQLWQSGNPIGSRVDLANREYTVVGVARDVLNDPYAPPQPEIYLPLLQAPKSFPAVYILARTAGSPESIADTIRSRIWEIDPNQPISDVASYATLVRRRNRYGYFLTLLQASFAVLGVSLAALGIYSVLSYAVGQRTREICLRMALGAQRQEMLRLVIRQAAAPVLGGMIVGLAAAIGLAMYAKSRLPLFLFQIRETDAMTYSAVTLFLLAVAAVSAYLPARDATRLDPASVLRHD